MAAARGGLFEFHAGEGLARRDSQLNLHEIEPRHTFGDGVLDLKSGIRFDE